MIILLALGRMFAEERGAPREALGTRFTAHTLDRV